MELADLVQAVSAGICLYAGVTHLVLGLLHRPRNPVHLSFGALSLLFAAYSINLFFLYAALRSGSLERYVLTDRWGIATYYLAIMALFLFVAAYTRLRQGLWTVVVAAAYGLVAAACFLLPYPWVYTSIELTATFPPEITLSPWYRVEFWVTPLLLAAFTGVGLAGQWRRGEQREALALALAMGIFLATYAWDMAIEHGFVDTVLMAQYGFLAFIAIMSARLSGQTVATERKARQLAAELELRVRERTARLDERVEQLSVIYRVAHQVATSTDRQATLETAATALRQHLDAETTVIAVADAGGEELTLVAGSEGDPWPLADPDRSFPLDALPISRRALDSGRTQIVRDLRELDAPSGLKARWSALDLGPIIIVPLRSRGRSLGVLTIGLARPDRDVADEVIALAETIASDVATAVDNARLAESAREAAVVAERQRLARELHDSVTQSLYSLTLFCSGWRAEAEQGRLEDPAERFALLGEIGQQALREMRLLVHQLRPPDLAEVGLTEALQGRVDAVERRAGIEPRLLVTGDVDALSDPQEDELYHIGLEALNNALRHARASKVILRLEVGDDEASLSVQDDGRGFDPSAGGAGMGLDNMRDRAASLGGALSIASEPGAGTRVRVTLPMIRADG